MTNDASLFRLAEQLFPLKRTVMGPDVLYTLEILNDWMRVTMKRTEVPVGTRVFDWEVLEDGKNRRAYHPSVYDVPSWDGPLTYGEVLLPGREPKEVLLSTYTCHPQMANDNVSGMAVTAALAKWLASEPRRYTYRCLFAPETIGALCWIKSNEREAWNPGKPSMGHGAHSYTVLTLPPIIAGYTINNCGDERAWSFIPSRKGDTLADRAARHVLKHITQVNGGYLFVGEESVRMARELFGDLAALPRYYREYSFADRGSDERQFCAPGVDLPVASVMRSKHGTYPEYHTKDDKLGTVVTARGLGDSFRCYQRIIEAIEANRTYRVTTTGEPMLSRHGLYPSGTIGGPQEAAKIARDLCGYSDGSSDLIAIADATHRPIWDLAPIAQQLADAGLLTTRD